MTMRPICTRTLARHGLPALLLLILAMGSPVPAQPAGVAEGAQRIFKLEAHLYSMTEQLGSLFNYSQGEIGGISGELTLTCIQGARHFEVRVGFAHREDKLLSTVTITPHADDAQTREQTIDLDLSDMRPLAIELAHDDSTGRVYYLKLVPLLEVIERQAARFSVESLALDEFTFEASPIIINDQQFAGRFSASGGELAWLQLPGIGRVEFSLRPFREAQASGRLDEGRLTLRLEDQTAIQIDSVANGTHKLTLPGGPYRVYVRHAPSEETREAAIERAVHEFEAMVASESMGEVPPERLEAMLERIRQGQWIACGVRALTDEER